MNQSHSVEPSGSHASTGSDDPRIYRTGEIPRFKHAGKFRPRYSPALAIVVAASFIGSVVNLVRAIHGPAFNIHYLGDATTDLVLFIATCALWSSWEREQRFPQQLPRKEFERQFPPSAADEPSGS